MNNKSIFKAGTFAFALLGVGAFANAAEYTWDYDTSYGHNPGGGVINSAQAVFNTVSGRTRFAANFSDVPNSTLKTQGFWLAMSPGPNPKGHAGELAIYYMDASKIDGIANQNAILSVYAYNGTNGDTSFKDGDGKGSAPDRIINSIATKSWINSLKMVQNGDGTRTFSFDINATTINNHVPKYPGPGGPGEWTGSKFGEQIGIWFHPVAGLTTDYRSDGFLKQFDYGCQGWLDGSNFKTTPEPATFLALGLGAAAMLRKRSKKA